eukprot:jgi/Psemu1/187503/e_gw1.68.103.1
MKDGSDASDQIYDLIVVGGGVVGLACLRAATLQGWKCALVEAERDLLTQASGGNSGIVCTGVDAAAGTLERALIRDSISEFRSYCKSQNVPIRSCGSLVCLFPWDSVLEESHIAGDNDAVLFASGQEVLREKERNVSQSLMGAVHIPGEVVVDSWVYSISLAVHALENGADIYTNFRVGSIDRVGGGDDHEHDGDDHRLWKVEREEHEIPTDNNIPTTLRGKAIVNATGNWSDLTEHSTHGTCGWVAKPRRGQYRVYESNAQTWILHPLQPIPSQRTKGIFVFSSLYDQLVVGPTALDQSSRTDRSVDLAVARELDDHIRRVIPGIDTEASCVGDYVGIRPGTNHRDYQIQLRPQQRWIAVAGIRSTGLTASLGIGNYVVRLLRCILEDPPATETQPHRAIHTTPLPALEELARDFATRGDGCCAIHGRPYRVTHPLTILGFESLASKTSKSANCH